MTTGKAEGWAENSNVIDWDSKKSKSKWGESTYKRCYYSHPPLELKISEGGTKFVYGGSCSSPIHDDAHIYVGLDWGMKEHSQRFPWVLGAAIHYEITDNQPPKNADEFRELVDWLADEIRAGKKVHIGCIGGHGRTGLVLSALVSVLTDEQDQIMYVRKNYCKKAVESKSQVDFLVKHYGCKEVTGSKAHSHKSKKKAKAVSNITTVNPVKASHHLFGDLTIER